jgi:AcrR family transcriptional regulator
MPRIAASERDAYQERRKASLRDAAVRLFAERGFEGASVEALAREAGLAKGTFYLYFPTKQALLDDVVQRYSLLPDVERIAVDLRGQPLEQIVPLLVRAVWSRLMERREIIMLLYREMPRHLHHARYFMERVVVPTNRLFAGVLEHSLGPERSREIDTLVAGRGLLGMVIIFFLTQQVLGGEEVLPIPVENIISTLSEVFLHGVKGAGA